MLCPSRSSPAYPVMRQSAEFTFRKIRSCRSPTPTCVASSMLCRMPSFRRSASSACFRSEMSRAVNTTPVSWFAGSSGVELRRMSMTRPSLHRQRVSTDPVPRAAIWSYFSRPT